MQEGICCETVRSSPRYREPSCIYCGSGKACSLARSGGSSVLHEDRSTTWFLVCIEHDRSGYGSLAWRGKDVLYVILRMGFLGV